MSSTIGLQNLILALQQALVPSSYAGVVGAGSALDTVVDATGGFATNQWQNWGIQFRADTTTAALRGAWQQITSNNGTDLVLAANLPAIPAAGDTYNIRPFGANVFDLQAVGGTAQTGADWTPIFQAIRDRFPAVAALADAAANPNLSGIGSYLFGYNGVTWDRLRSTLANGLQVDVTQVQGTVTVDTELPAAGALADAAANPTTPTVGAAVLGFNGVSWDRLRTSIANGLQVDVTRVQGTVTVDSELPAAAALADATANPTVPSVGSFQHGYNGTTWDRLRSVNTGQLVVTPRTVGGADVTAATGAAVPAGAIQIAGQSTGGLLGVPIVSGDAGDGQSSRTGMFAWTQLIGYNGTTWDRLRSTIANGLVVDVSRVQGTVTVDTELPAAAVLGDATANPTVPAAGTFVHGFNGVTWDRLRSVNTGQLAITPYNTSGLAMQANQSGDSGNGSGLVATGLWGWGGASWDRLRSSIANGLQVDVTRVQGTVTVDSELPAAAALGDTAANPTVPGVGGFLLGFNGVTWDRVRTVNTGQLRNTQYDSSGNEVSSRFIPIAKAAVFNLAAPGANTNILGADVTPTNSPSVLRVTVLLATGSVFKARVTNSATTFDADFNGGTALAASSVYIFDLPWRTGDSVNFQVETDGVIQMLRAEEIGAAA